ncbi:protein ECERIFERUM 26-like [Tasmannia lanceolata]|uniref:protein ECERIFERUM 26-like n=1 Tax=Tasmannia lanceolata TaxID=3420 RepID=UPI00406322CB
MAEVRFLCKRTVVSTKPVKPGKFYSLSVLDHAMEQHNVRIIYYYRFQTKFDVGGITEKLRESLSETLTSFPIVTGRLLKNPEGHWMVKCNDAGVRMIEARASGSVEEWLQTADRVQELKLTYWEDMFHKQYFWSTFYVQLTEFEGGGLAIGLSCSHLLADTACATMLIKAWADTSLLGKILSPPYVHSLPPRKLCYKSPDHKINIDLINHYEAAMALNKHFPSSDVEQFTTVTFAFTEDMVNWCMAESSMPDGPTPTTFEALAGLFWVCVSRAKGRKNGLLDISICLEMRKVLGLDKGFFGNAMVFSKVYGEGLKEGGLVEAGKAVSDAVGKMGNEGVMDLIEWLESERGGREKLSEERPILSGPELVCANWESLSSYKATFEVGVEPIRVSCYLERVFGEGQVLILPSPEDEGPLSRMVMVTLPQTQIVKLCEEALILKYSPTILMGAKKTQV